MKLKRPKTCYGCRGLLQPGKYTGFRCWFGYMIDTVRHIKRPGVAVDVPVPFEPCPKPKTWNEWCEADAKGKEGATP
jgi:hypothetical protein